MGRFIEYAIKIEGRYFKEYVYFEENRYGRFGGITDLGIIIKDGDIIDVITTKEPERLETPRGIGDTISILLRIETVKGKKIEIIPITE